MKTALSIIPQHLFSHITGLLVSVPLPRFIRKPLFDWYIGNYGVNLSDIDSDPYDFSCLGKFFVRNLKAGIRPISGSLVSPVDGTLRSFGQISDGTVLEVKGQAYRVSELLGQQVLAEKFQDGSFFNFYLAPGDYHHVHSPITGVATDIAYVPGKLWPVNTWAWSNIPKLLVENERVSVLFNSEFGRVAVVMIGALNVGSIKMRFPELETLQGAGTPGLAQLSQISTLAGERIGTFEMGSSVVVLLEKKVSFGQSLKAEQKIKFGSNLGQ
jgi:phosphatidylserine decarboxylase